MRARLRERAAAWRVDIDQIVETQTSLLGFGSRNGLEVVLKVTADHRGESRAGEVLRAFPGRAVVRVHEYCAGAMLLERAAPGRSLAAVVSADGDNDAMIGELEFEIGAALRNPHERPDLYADPAIARRRAGDYARILGLDAGRILSWAFAQAVLSVIWWLEDGEAVRPDDGRIRLARAIRC